MPEEITFNSLSRGRIPRVSVKIGDPKDVFAVEAPSTTVRELGFTHQWYQQYGKEVTRGTGGWEMERFNAAKCMTFKSLARPEHTRLTPASLWNYDLPIYTGGTLSAGHDPNLNQYEDENVDHVWSLLPDAEKNYPQHPKGVHYMTPIMKDVTISKVSVYVSGNNGDNPDLGEQMLFADVPHSTAVYSEVIPSREVKVIRVAQTNSDPWVVGALRTNYKLPSPPSIYIEIEKKKPPKDQKSLTLPSAEGGVSKTLFNPYFSIQLDSECTLRFEHKQPPVAMKHTYDLSLFLLASKSKQTLIKGEADKTIDLESLNKITLDIRAVPILDAKDKQSGGTESYQSGYYYVVTSNMFSTPWTVIFEKEIDEVSVTGKKTTQKKVDPLYKLPDGAHLTFTFAGLGVFTFALAPIRYTPIGTGHILGKVGRTVSDTDYLEALYSTKDLICTKSVKPKQVKSDIKAYVEKDSTSSDVILNYTAKFTSTTDIHTPYVFSTDFNLPALASTSSAANLKEINSNGIVAIQLDPKIENLFKIRTAGSITLYNYGEGDSRYSRYIDWDHFYGMKGIVIDFKWDDEDEWTTIFTGYVLGPKHSRENYGKQTVTLKLEDRFFALDRILLTNCPFFDGASWVKAFKMLAKYGGFTEDQIYIDPNFQYLKYNIPYAGNYIQNPQYRFPYGTTVMTAMDKLLDLVRAFVFVDPKGVLTILDPATAMAETPVTFYANPADSLGAEDADDIYNIFGPYKYDVSSDSIYNVVVTGGPNFSPGNSENWGFKSILVDGSSITDNTASNFIGVQAQMSFFKVWLCSQRLVNDKCAELYGRVRYPLQTVNFTSHFYKYHRLYTPCVLNDPTGSISKVYYATSGETTVESDMKFWITGASFSYSSEKLQATSTIQATMLRGVIED